MTTNHVVTAMALLTMASAHANLSYKHPVTKDVSRLNYDQTGFAAAKQPLRFESKTQIKVGSTIMPYDRYHRVFEKRGDEFVYKDLIARLDRLQVLELNGDDSNPYIKVKVLSSTNTSFNGRTFYTRVKGLSEYEDYKNHDADVYMVQNIATEKLRVYQRVCKDNSCPPKMIFETDFVSGMKKGDPEFKKNTHVGSYRIFEWEKFYQDAAKHYPSWYSSKANYPAPPEKDDSWSAWFDKDVMPEVCKTVDGETECKPYGDMRGAFGWYTALVEPQYGTGQWTHGTIGWAESSVDNIYRAKGEDTLGRIANFFTSLRSSGCSRVSNPAVAFLRHILPVGTPLIKVYALEAYQDQDSMERNYTIGSTSTWNFILTKDGERKVDEEATNAHSNYVMARGLNTEDNVLEEGTYEFNTFPSIVQYQYKPKSSGNGYRRSKGCVEDTVDNYPKAGQVVDKRDRSLFDIDGLDKLKSKKCNIYGAPAESFTGRFYVDTGLIDGYQHPKAAGVIRGGFRSENWPAFMEVKNYKK